MSDAKFPVSDDSTDKISPRKVFTEDKKGMDLCHVSKVSLVSGPCCPYT